MKFDLVDYLFCHNRISRLIIIKLYAWKERGEFHSLTLRKLFLKHKKIEVGIGSYGWTGDFFKGPAKIGKYCSLGPGVIRYEKNHIITGVTTHPCWFNPVYGWVEKDPRKSEELIIGNDVWIGANVIILPSCHQIGDGAIIAAGSVLTKDVPPMEIWGGVPSHKIKDRFEGELSNLLLKSEWWNLPEEKLKQLAPYYKNPLLFLEKYHK